MTGIANSSVLPARVLIRAEGQFPIFDDFYLAQLADVLRQKGCEFHWALCAPQGLRGSVDWLLNECHSRYLLMVADDVLIDPLAVERLSQASASLDSTVGTEAWGYVVGNKQDVNNVRGWPDYSQKPIRAVTDYATTYGVYDVTPTSVLVRNHLLDNSFALFNAAAIRKRRVTETQFPYGFQCGGDDTLFGWVLRKAQLPGYFMPMAQAFHLEKPQGAQNFTEPAARAEALLRQAQLLGISLTRAEIEQMFPYTKRYGTLVNP